MTTADYIDNINRRYMAGNATEHTFRGDLQQLIEALVPEVSATNEPKRQKCGAPDYVLTKNDFPIGFIEAKDIGDNDLAGEKKGGNKEQFDRYKAALGNIVFTDYLSFFYYKDAELVAKISIGALTDKGIRPLPENFDSFSLLMKEFCEARSQTIATPQKLAAIMANKARMLAESIEKSILSDVAGLENSMLKEQLDAFREILIHDITPKAFADVYAQTIAYGMFAARCQDPASPDFSRQRAADLIPKSNPFLRKLFQYIAGYDLDSRIRWIVDNLVEVFLACNVEQLLKGYGKETRQEEPIIHFYETFLSEYDPALRKARGVWYTPQPVVNFIVRATDELLKTEFGLRNGIFDYSLADPVPSENEEDEEVSPIPVKPKKRGKIPAEPQGLEPQGSAVTAVVPHKVKILDPATGTGTFLAETIKYIYDRYFKGMKGAWPRYVDEHLIPRLNGFELLMASYAMAHLQLDLLLRETGIKLSSEQRFRIFLTNSLEESHPYTKSLFAGWLSAEANEANNIKRDVPVMCVMGNPPYNVSSSNKSVWIGRLTEEYKKGLEEKNIQPLSDDYVKFIRMGQHLIDKNKKGVLAYISNNSFLDGLIHRQMRKSLLESFDKIYILDLHGNAKKKETADDGGADQNVFDIQQGVSINIFVKTGEKEPGEIGKVFHLDLQGKRQDKYGFLLNNSLKTAGFEELNPQQPYYFFVKKDFAAAGQYKLGFKIDELFNISSSGIKTHRDEFVIDLDQKPLLNRIEKFYDKSYTDYQIQNAFKLENNRDWQLESARKNGKAKPENIQKILYRPFDERFIYYDKNLIDFSRENVMQHIIGGSMSFICLRQARNKDQGTFWLGRAGVLVGKDVISPLDTSTVFPLYQCVKASKAGKAKQASLAAFECRPNLHPEIVDKIAERLGLRFIPEKTGEAGTFAPLDILDYVYAVLHSPKYRETYKEFLKIDFPSIPYPADAAGFWRLAALGGRLRILHLSEESDWDRNIASYPEAGPCIIKKPVYKDGRIYISETEYFENVPETAWTAYIGGYQPAQKWLKDRKERKVEFYEIGHYQLIIAALLETEILMKKIDEEEM